MGVMIEQFEMVAKAVGDTNRARILKMLEPGELCVCQITAVIGLAPATVSKHLSVLRMAGLVRQRKAGRWIHYRLTDQAMNPYALPILDVMRRNLADDQTVSDDRARLVKVLRTPLETLCAPITATRREDTP